MPPTMQRLLSPKLTGFCGIVGYLLIYVSTFLAITISPWFTWTGYALSNLGDLAQTSAPLFNGGLIVGGVILVFFALGLMARVRGNILGTIGTILLFAAAVGVVGVGVFPMNFVLPHIISAITIFVSDPLALFLFGMAFALRRTARFLSMISFAMCVVAIFIWLLPWGPGIAIPEFVAISATYLFIVIISARLITGKEGIPRK